MNSTLIPGTYGLALCGGKSSRMGTDKSLLTYHAKPQRYHVHEMMEPFCEKVFISCNVVQLAEMEDGYDLLMDDTAYQDIGPMAALLTAFDHFPEKNFLVLGCDYPFLTGSELQRFAALCIDPSKAVAFYNEPAGCYEPLLAWYPYTAFDTIKKMHLSKQYSLQQFLKDSEAIKYYPQRSSSIQSIDTIEAARHAQHIIGSQ